MKVKEIKEKLSNIDPETDLAVYLDGKGWHMMIDDLKIEKNEKCYFPSDVDATDELVVFGLKY